MKECRKKGENAECLESKTAERKKRAVLLPKQRSQQFKAWQDKVASHDFLEDHKKSKKGP